jgi:hypothetical protein
MYDYLGKQGYTYPKLAGGLVVLAAPTWRASHRNDGLRLRQLEL